jgi:AAA domain, putative AbiEii toxin, Type IV TA system
LNDIEEILQYDSEFMTDLFLYYPKYGESTVDKGNYIDGFISFMPTDKKLSSGQNALLNFFSRLYDFLKLNLIGQARFLPDKKHYLLLLDEADLGFHPQWKKLFIKSLVNSLPHFFEMLEKKPTLQIIFTTHDPLTLSDLPNSNVVYVAKRENKSTVLSQIAKDRPTKTFGANISDLLADSFFINNGLIGEFAKDKIEATINWINENKVKKRKKADFEKELKFHKKVIEIIDEKVIKLKLAEMTSELESNNDFAIEMINNEMKILQERLNMLQ